jgi:hypothetical protein
MMIRAFVSIAAAAMLALAPAAARAQTQTPPPPKPPETKPESKPDAKAEAKPATPASLAGKWTVSVETGQGPLESALELKADAKEPKKVTGTIISQMGEAAVEGEVVDGKLTFWITINGGGGELSVTFVGTQQKDGSLAGTFNFGQGEMPWTAVRVKG